MMTQKVSGLLDGCACDPTRGSLKCHRETCLIFAAETADWDIAAEVWWKVLSR